MSSDTAMLSTLEKRAQEADLIIDQLKSQLQSVRQSAVAKACLADQQRLAKENEDLRQEVERLKNELNTAEAKRGVKQIQLPGSNRTQQTVAGAKSATVANAANQKAPASAKPVAKTAGEADKPKETPKAEKKEKKPSEPKAAVKTSAPSGAGEQIDVSRLNMRVGRIVNVKKHPDADSLYVEEVDVGEAKNRTIVSGLVKHVPIEEMQDRIAVFLLNLKPAKMRGVSSEGMIMCASSPDKVEIIVPPSVVTVGDRVVVDGFPGSPDEQLNPKKKTWEQIQPDLRINLEGVATYKGARWLVEGKEGLFKAPSMVDSAIK